MPKACVVFEALDSTAGCECAICRANPAPPSNALGKGRVTAVSRARARCSRNWRRVQSST